jgi:hypothetical protein
MAALAVLRQNLANLPVNCMKREDNWRLVSPQQEPWASPIIRGWGNRVISTKRPPSFQLNPAI